MTYVREIESIVADLACRLHSARIERRPVPTITSSHASFTEENAYEVQAAGIKLRTAAGEKIIGGKLGFTSRAMQLAMGVDCPNYGWLTDAMLIHDQTVRLADFIHPKVEPEIAFLLGADLAGAVSNSDVLAATEAVMPCLEVVDSRFVDFKFAAFDNIADNSSAAGVVFGRPTPIDELRLDLIGVALSEHGTVVHTAAGAAALDHPAAAVAFMANRQSLSAGQVVISGGLTSPIRLRPGSVVTAEFSDLGTVHLRAI